MRKYTISLITPQLPCCIFKDRNLVFLNEYAKDYELYKNYNLKKTITIKHPRKGKKNRQSQQICITTCK